MDVETLLQLQSEANQVNTLETLPPPLPTPSLPPPPAAQMVTMATQTLTWNELTLQMISDVVSHQVIHMHRQEVPSNTLNTTPCRHHKGMTWKDIANMVSHSHDTLCTETGIKLAENMIQVTVDWPPSFDEDYVKTSIEIHFAEQIDPGDVGGAIDQIVASGLTGLEGNTVDDHDAVNDLGEWRNLTSKQTHQSPSKQSKNCSKASPKDHVITPKSSDIINTDDEPHDSSMMKTPNVHHENAVSKFDKEVEKFDKVVDAEMPETCQNVTEAVQNFSNNNDQSELIIKEESSSVVKILSENDPGTQNLRSKRSMSHKCEDCGQLCRTLELLKRHMQTHSGKSQKKQSGFECGVCNKVFKSRWKLRKHEPVHAPGHDVHPCQHCDKICKTSQSLQRHRRVHDEPPLYSCNDCGISFRAQVQLKQHLTKVHNMIGKHECNICGAVYKNETTLKDHLVEHSGKEFLCDICGKKFRRPELLRCHRFRHSMQNKPKSFNCSMCPKAYATDTQLQIHIRLTHMKERENICKMCGKKFFYRYQLVAHEKAHNGIMQHTCKYCNKGFLKKASLVAHEMVHTGNKPYKCRHCLKGFATKGHQQRHERLHTDSSKPERAFQCNICNAKFRYKGQYKDHEKRHAGVKDHNCTFCSKCFVSRSDLMRHLRTHTAGKPHKCQHCDQTFSKRKELLTHEVSHGETKKSETGNEISQG
ncbi:uncharacterized protein [Amphiura filiformis]|uniref:uncharacterized protein n=1 Tax=Amphiura filiformis TaxID=82378 RepID=UPI003B212F70